MPTASRREDIALPHRILGSYPPNGARTTAEKTAPTGQLVPNTFLGRLLRHETIRTNSDESKQRSLTSQVSLPLLPPNRPAGPREGRTMKLYPDAAHLFLDDPGNGRKPPGRRPGTGPPFERCKLSIPKST